ncbi:MAG: hypothetical protein QGF53_05215 [Alphaproteobacteria bacterium]|nr:hypothetical protein [Alphaproteobacteria bacterium]
MQNGGGGQVGTVQPGGGGNLLNPGGGGGGGEYCPSVDTPGVTDCWASAGCTDYDGDTGTYTYEDCGTYDTYD